jgi:hypothetical protein
MLGETLATIAQVAMLVFVATGIAAMGLWRDFLGAIGSSDAEAPTLGPFSSGASPGR